MVEFLSSPLTLPASVAGALAALFVVLAILAARKVGPQAFKIGIPIAAAVMGCLAVIAFLDRMAQNDHAAERRALERRDVEFTVQSVAPGSMLGCLNSAAGEKVESACEKAVFADPQSAASAVAYVTARLALLADGLAFARRSDPAFAETLSGVRRSIELDRFGIAAHVLATRDGCTADRCSAFALLRDTTALQANLRVRAYNEYVARHATAWNNEPQAQAPVASVPAPAQSAAPAVASAPEAPGTVGRPVSSRFDFPSAASIPPVSIMNAEPPLPPAAAAANAAEPVPAQAAETARVPVPPRRPQIEAATPPAQ